MKTKILLLITVALLSSCSNDEKSNSETRLTGKWKLIEVLADPGNGSGTFKSVESNTTIEFKNNGIIETNTSLCNPYSDEMIDSGTYNLSNKTITTNCQNPNIATINFELQDQHLVLNFISNEGYSQKFKKIN